MAAVSSSANGNFINGSGRVKEAIENELLAISTNTPSEEMQEIAILGTDPVAFESLLAELTIDNTNVDTGKLLSVCKTMHSDSMLLKLLHTLRFSQTVDSRALAAGLLRKHLPSAWPALSPLTQASIKDNLLLCFQNEHMKDVFRKVCFVISDLTSIIINHHHHHHDVDDEKTEPNNHIHSEGHPSCVSEEWTELIPFLLSQCSSPNSPIQFKEGALLIFARLAKPMALDLHPHLPTLISVLKDAFDNSDASSHAKVRPDDIHLKLAAFRATSNFIRVLSHAVHLEPFQNLVPGIAQTLIQLPLNLDEEASAQKALEMFTEVAQVKPMVLVEPMHDVVCCALDIIDSRELQDSTRHMAMELIITLAEARNQAPGLVKKISQLLRRILSTLLLMLLDVVDNPAWHSAETDDESAGEGHNFHAGQEFLDRLANALGGSDVLPVLYDLLPVFISDEDWRRRYAALISVSQVSEGCSKTMIGDLEPALNMVLDSFQDPHPKVRWAAINVIGQMSIDLSPNFQEKYHQLIVPSLLDAMGDRENPRIQAHSAAALLNFSGNSTSMMLAPYLDGIVSKLLFLLQNDKCMVQEAALTALASIANCVEIEIVSYYDTLMPCLKSTLVNATNKSKKQLHLKCVECITCVGTCAGKENFGDDAKELVQTLVKLHESQKTNGDVDYVTMEYVLQGFTRICECMGQEILQYMDLVMPSLLEIARLKPDVSIVNTVNEDIIPLQNGDSDIVYLDNESFETITICNMKIEIRTIVLERKANACKILCTLALELKDKFHPWIDEMLSIVLSMLKCSLSKDIRKVAFFGVPALLVAAKCVVEREVGGKDAFYVKQLSNFLVPTLIQALSKEFEIDVILEIIHSIDESIKVIGNFFDIQHMKGLMMELKHVVTKFNLTTNDVKEVEHCLSSVIKETFKSHIIPYFADLMSIILLMLGNNCTPQERHMAISILNVVAKQCEDLVKCDPILVGQSLCEILATFAKVYMVGVQSPPITNTLKFIKQSLTSNFANAWTSLQADHQAVLQPIIN